MDIKQETTADLLLLIIQQATLYQDHKSELADELDYIGDLIEQLKSRLPHSCFILINTLKEEKDALDKVAPEYLIYALEDLRIDLGT